MIFTRRIDSITIKKMLLRAASSFFRKLGFILICVILGG